MLKVNFDPLYVLRRSYNRWIPVGGRPVFNLRSATTDEITKMIKKLKKSQAFGRGQY